MNARRLMGIALLNLALVVGTAVPAFAGGWAVITVDSLPQGVAPGVAFTIGFTVRQHGMTPLSDLAPVPAVEARNPATGEVVRSDAAPGGGPGHYAAHLTLPSAGEWSWSIRAFGPEPQPMPPIVVAAASRPAAEPTSARVPIALAAAVLAVAGIGLALRRRFVFSGVTIALAAVVGGASMVRSTPAVTVAEAASPSPYDQGAALFLAKGCVVCHMNRDLADSESFSLSIGPDLSQYSNDSAFLSGWLAGPAAVRAGAQMPDLRLSAEEIESLIAFLNGEGGA